MTISQSAAKVAAASCRILGPAKGMVALALLLLHVGCAGPDLTASGRTQAQPGPGRSDDPLFDFCSLRCESWVRLVVLAPQQESRRRGAECEIRGGEMFNTTERTCH